MIFEFRKKKFAKCELEFDIDHVCPKSGRGLS